MTKNIAILKIVSSPAGERMMSLVDNNRIQYVITFDESNKVDCYCDHVLESFIYNNNLTEVAIDNLKSFLNDVAKVANNMTQADVIIENNKTFSIDNVNLA